MTSMILGPPLGWSWSVERFASLHNHLLLEIPEGYRWSNGTSLAMIATLRFTENCFQTFHQAPWLPSLQQESVLCFWPHDSVSVELKDVRSAFNDLLYFWVREP